MPKIKIFNCKYCNTEIHRKAHADSRFLYCSITCQITLDYERRVALWLNNKLTGWTGKTRQLKPFVKKYIHNTRGTACVNCAWDEKHAADNKPLTEINHIDGNAENCSPDNLEVLCPNCHAKTYNFKARNKNSKRKRS